MKLLPLLALNVLVAGTSILAYDVLTTPAEAPPVADDSAALEALEERLDALERSMRMQSGRSDRALVSRTSSLEERLATPKSMPIETAAVADVPAASVRDAAMAALAGDDAASVARLKVLMERSESDRRAERETQGMDRLLDRLGLELTEEQSKRLGEEMGAHRDRMREYVRGARAEGLERKDVRAGREGLRGELQATLATFLSPAEAETIAAQSGGGGPGGRRGNRSGRAGGIRR
jgi:hypothetical protein